MSAVTIKALNDAANDCQHIADIATSPALTATDRFGRSKRTLAGAVASVASITPRGAWASGTAYVIKDVVLQAGTWYICVAGHTAGATFSGDAGNWRVYQGVTAADLANEDDPELSAGLVKYLRALAYRGWTVGGKLSEHLSLLDFIPPALHANIRAFTSTADLTTYINAAFAAANGRRLLAPAGLYNHGQLQVPKACKLALVGEFSSYDDTEGTVFNYTGTGIGLQVGVDDGNPDVTGKAPGAEVRSIHFKTTSGAPTALRLQNTALAQVVDCVTRGFTGKIVELKANVITTVRDNDIAGVIGTEGVGQGSYGIWCDDQYFGNFVVDIENNHIFQVNHAGRFAEGRSLRVYNNVVENIRPGALGGVWEFATTGYISLASFELNYYENHHGFLYEGSTFTGAILMLSVKREDGWGSADAAHPNPGVGNIPRTRVVEHDISGNVFVDAALNTAAALVMPSVYQHTSVFDTLTTILRSQVTGREYEADLMHSMQVNELLRSAGDFASLSGATTTTATGGALVVTGAGATPSGWTNLATQPWQLILDAVHGSWACYVPASGDFNRCSRVVPITPVARARFFVIGFTTKGWSALLVNDTAIYDSGVNRTEYHTEAIRFTVPAGASSITLRFTSNASNPFFIAEARLYEIGAAEYVEPGTANNTVVNAVKRLMKRGIY